MKTQTAVVLQARMGSNRLPGKSLADLGGRSILGQCLARLLTSGVPVILATTALAEDDCLEAEARQYGVDVHRGDAEDVLGRFLSVAKAFGLTHIVRATADNPAVDPGGVARTLDLLSRARADHVVECGLPLGGAVEAVKVQALLDARERITDAYDREHVTPFLRRDPAFRAIRALGPGVVRRPGLRLTVDTADDLQFLRDVFAAFPPMAIPALTDIIRAAEAVLERTAEAVTSGEGQ